MEYFGVPLSFWIAFGAGITTFFSPCLLPVLPGFFAFLGGSAARKEKDASRWNFLFQSFLFVLGFTLVFIVLQFAFYLGKPFFAAHKNLFEQIGGILVVIFGLFIVGVLKIPFLQKERRFAALKTPFQALQSFLFGIIFGFSWSPCLGPIVSVIFYIATTEMHAAAGYFFIGAFSLGLALPFLIFSLFVPELSKILRKIKFFSKYSKYILGSLMVGIGVLLFLGKLGIISAKLTVLLGKPIIV